MAQQSLKWMCVLKCVQLPSRHWSMYALPFQIRLSQAGGLAGGAEGGGGVGGEPGGGGEGGSSGPGLLGGGLDGGEGGNGGGAGLTLQRAISSVKSSLQTQLPPGCWAYSVSHSGSSWGYSSIQRMRSGLVPG